MAHLPVPKNAHRPLTAWVYGGNMYVKSFSHYEGEIILPESIFVSIDTFYHLHEAPRVPLKSLEQSWDDTKTYILRTRALLGRPHAGWSLSDDDRKKVLASIGEPPGPAWPLYVIAVGDYPDERIVYIGKTNAQTHRFTTGHSAITALHDPKYYGMTKRLYLATVTLMSDEGNYVPLEWLHPKGLRNSIWSDVEAQMIYHFQPELNRKLKERDHSKNPVGIAFHNYSGTKSFDAEYIAAHRIVTDEDWIPLL
jgi:hypothetical protein